MSELFGNRYRSTGITYQGGSGVVCICDDPNLSRRVAIKFLGAYRDKRRIYDEIAALMSIRSKNVVQIYDILIEPGNNIGIVEEFLDGPALSDPLPKPAAAPELLRVLYQVSNGVADIHAHSLIHRDIKPNNMRFTPDGLLKIFDFDLARALDKAETVGFKGTRGFAAPELYEFEAHFGPAVDVYALAATMVAYQSGRIPADLYKQPPTPEAWVQSGGLSAALAGFPDTLIELLGRALSSDPSRRPAAKEIQDEAAAQLLRGSHRALVVGGGQTHYCDARTHPFISRSGEGRWSLPILGRGSRSPLLLVTYSSTTGAWRLAI